MVLKSLVYTEWTDEITRGGLKTRCTTNMSAGAGGMTRRVLLWVNTNGIRSRMAASLIVHLAPVYHCASANCDNCHNHTLVQQGNGIVKSVVDGNCSRMYRPTVFKRCFPTLHSQFTYISYLVKILN